MMSKPKKACSFLLICRKMSHELVETIVGVLSVITPAYLTIYLTLSIFRCEISTLRLIFCAVLLGFYSILEKKLSNPTLLLKGIITTIALLIAKREYTFLEFVKVVIIYVIVKVISLAFRYLIIALLHPNEALITIIISLSIVVTAFVIKVLNFALKDAKRLKKVHMVEVINGERSFRFKAFLDTGNMLYDKGQPVIIVSAKVASSIKLKPDREIVVSTIAGFNVLKGGRASIKIFLDKKAHKVLPIVYAISDKMLTRGYDVLLHKDMEQI